MKVHLVDGTFELFRAFFSWPSSVGAGGREVGAAKGFLSMLRRLVAEPGVTHVACAFDHVIESFRNQMFAGYKTGEGIDPSLYGQFGFAEQVCTALGIVTWSMVEFEADDALATGAARYAADPEVEQVLICSPDKDLMQCVRGDRVVCWDRMRDRISGEAGVIEKFGIGPSSIPDYLALVGDTADGIPGIPRWGKKAASTLLAEYGHLEAIPAAVADWRVKPRGGEALAETLRSGLSDALLYRQLATLRLDVPLPQATSDLRYLGASRERLREVCEELADFSPMEQVRWNEATSLASHAIQ